MVIDFAFILVVFTALSGLIWALDRVWWRGRRIEKAVRRGEEPPREPILVEYSRSLFPVLLIVLVFRSFLFEPFRIPSGSMMPTLLEGDFIVVNKYAYGLRLPVANTEILAIGDPGRGDVVVFRYPLDPAVNFIKRVVGLPGDTITWRGKQLYVNGEVVPLAQEARYSDDEVKCERPNPDAVRYTETLDGREHAVLLHERSPSRDLQWEVPEGHYFVMGDNRDRSNDSREWGFVPRDNLLGRAVGIWLNWNISRGCGDFSRIGDGIR